MSPDVGDEDWVPIDDRLARIPDLLDLWHHGAVLDKEWPLVAESLEAAQARIVALTADKDKAEEEAERYQAALESVQEYADTLDPVISQSIHSIIQAQVYSHVLAPARPATEPRMRSRWTQEEIDEATREANRMHRLLIAADEPQEDGHAD